MQSNLSLRLDRSRVSWKGHDIFHVSQLTPYLDGANLFPSLTTEPVHACDVAHLDGWEPEDKECTINELKAARINSTTRKMEWFVSFQGYAAGLDLWIQLPDERLASVGGETLKRGGFERGSAVNTTGAEHGPPLADTHATWQDTALASDRWLRGKHVGERE